MGSEGHRSQRGNWLRAAVLGANDGLISTASLVVGVASAAGGAESVFLAASAGMVAGALSMAAGEYVSVSSQTDTQKADLAREERELATDPQAETEELKRIYVARGLDDGLAGEVASALMANDALGAHALDELGIHERSRPKPIQAALASAGAFMVGALPPVVLTALLPVRLMSPAVVASTTIFLVVLGGLAAQLGGASRVRGALRVLVWGLLAMGVTALVGGLVGNVGGQAG